MSDIDLAAIRARVDAATAPPWSGYTDDTLDRCELFAGPLDECGCLTGGALSKSEGCDCGCGSPIEADMQFIAHARTDVPALLALVDAQAARIDKVLALHGDPNEDYRCRQDGGKWPCATYRALTEDPQ